MGDDSDREIPQAERIDTIQIGAEPRTEPFDETGCTPTTQALDRYQSLSGFPSTTAWSDAIDALHGATTESGYLYHVTEREPDE